MGLESFDYAIPGLAILFATFFLGGFLVLSAWVAAWIAGEPGRRRIPIALWAFTASVGTVFVTAGIMRLVMLHLGDRAGYYSDTMRRDWTICIVVSFVLMLTSFIVACREASPVQFLIQIGSGMLIVVNLLGFIYFFVFYYIPYVS